VALKELYHGRVGTSAARVEFMRAFEGLTTDLTAGDGGWTATGLPVYGDAYPYGTWTNGLCPTVGRVEVDPREQVGRVRVTVYYWAPMTRAAAV